VRERESEREKERKRESKATNSQILQVITTLRMVIEGGRIYSRILHAVD
jgi:hypothetical protein